MQEVKKLLLLISKEPEKGLSEATSIYGGMVYSIAASVLRGRPQDIEECVADTFLELWKNCRRLINDEYPLKAWLVVTARNKAIDRYRTLSIGKTFVLPLDEETEIVIEDTKTGEAEDAVEELVKQLLPPDKEIFIRKYYMLQTSKEIAAAVSLTEQNVNMRLSRGRERLKNKLMGMGLHIPSALRTNEEGYCGRVE